MLAWTAAWVWAGLTLYRLVERLAGPGARLEQAGGSFAGDVAEIQQKIGRLPVVGDDLQDPFGRLAGVGQTLADAGATQQQVVHQLALWLGVVVAAVPIAALLVAWLPRRVAWARRAGAAARLRLDGADLELFALRAVANRPLRQLHRVPRPGRRPPRRRVRGPGRPGAAGPRPAGPAAPGLAAAPEQGQAAQQQAGRARAGRQRDRGGQDAQAEALDQGRRAGRDPAGDALGRRGRVASVASSGRLGATPSSSAPTLGLTLNP